MEEKYFSTFANDVIILYVELINSQNDHTGAKENNANSINI